MANLFFISDTHFSHDAALSWTINESGTKMRPGFIDYTHMDDTMVDNWNKVVKPGDHAYHLGDVTMSRRFLPIVKRLNGKKRLIFGNHDIFDYQEYAAVGFKKLMGMRVIDNIIFTHVPVHPSQLRRFKVNVHGHLHTNLVGGYEGQIPVWTPDPRYINVCVEKINYTPIAFEEIKRLCR